MIISTLITGCRLVDDYGNRSVWGDLWEVDGEIYVFNAVLENGETAWQYDPNTESVKALASEKQIWLESPLPIFGKRGVIVFPCRYSRLNDAAQAYLRGQPIDLC